MQYEKPTAERFCQLSRVDPVCVCDRQINGTANESSAHYDALGRPDIIKNLLGKFDPAYLRLTARVDHVNWPNNPPNGQRTNCTWKPLPQDPRLDSITYLDTAGNLQSQHGYTYDAEGKIATWQSVLADNTGQHTSQYTFV